VLEERSSSIGEELKMVMKSERGGRLARDSAEILVGDRPGEFTVVTEEGSAIPVAVKDLSSSSGSSGEVTGQWRSAEPASGEEPAAGTSSAGAEGGDLPASTEAAPPRTFWSSMTAALGRKSGAGDDAAAADATEGIAAKADDALREPAAPPVLPVLEARGPKAPSPVSAFANEVAVKPVSADTTDSSAVAGAALRCAVICVCIVPSVTSRCLAKWNSSTISISARRVAVPPLLWLQSTCSLGSHDILQVQMLCRAVQLHHLQS
jgi:hypothetical protein